MKCRFLQTHFTVPFPSIWPCTRGNAVSSGARRRLLSACILKIVACNGHAQGLSSFHPFWSLFSLTIISLVCYSSCRLVPISQRMPGTWARTLCEEPAMSAIIAFPTRNETASLHVIPIDAAESLWQLDSRCTALPIVIRSQPIASSLVRTMSVSQDHEDPQAYRVYCRISAPRVIADYYHQPM